jgi:hypothetical protein
MIIDTVYLSGWSNIPSPQHFSKQAAKQRKKIRNYDTQQMQFVIPSARCQLLEHKTK